MLALSVCVCNAMSYDMLDVSECLRMLHEGREASWRASIA